MPCQPVALLGAFSGRDRGGGGERDGLAVGRVEIRLTPFFAPPADLGGIYQALLPAQSLERIEPAMEVGGALLGSALRGRLDLVPQSRGPLAPGEGPPLRKMHCQREGARLPGLREHRAVLIGRQRREVGGARGLTGHATTPEARVTIG